MPRKTKFQQAYNKGDSVETIGNHPWSKFKGIVTDTQANTPKGKGIKVSIEFLGDPVEIVILSADHVRKVGA